MNVRDPVCGMSFEQEEAVAVLQHHGRDHHFCSLDCRQTFASDPERFIGAGAVEAEDVRPGGPSAEILGGPSVAEGPDEGSTECPYCGSETRVARVGRPELGSLSIQELETMVRNEWRRVLGRKTYRRPHPRSLVRSLIRYGLAPESPDRQRAAQDELWTEIATLEGWGLSREAMRAELLALTQATLDVLEETTLDFEGTRSILERIETFIDETLGWPATSTR